MAWGMHDGSRHYIAAGGSSEMSAGPGGAGPSGVTGAGGRTPAAAKA